MDSGGKWIISANEAKELEAMRYQDMSEEQQEKWKQLLEEKFAEVRKQNSFDLTDKQDKVVKKLVEMKPGTFMKMMCAAGVGKTLTMFRSLCAIVDKYKSDVNVFMFNKAICKDMQQLVDAFGYKKKMTVRTFHSFCWRALKGKVKSVGELKVSKGDGTLTIIREVMSVFSDAVVQTPSMEKKYAMKTLVNNPRLSYDIKHVVKKYKITADILKKYVAMCLSCGDFAGTEDVDADFDAYDVQQEAFLSSRGVTSNDTPHRPTINRLCNTVLNLMLMKYENEATVALDQLLFLAFKQNVLDGTTLNVVAVDEAQDMNRVMARLLFGIVGHRSKIIFFGDFEQMIYSCFGAKKSIIDDFEQWFTDQYALHPSMTLKIQESLRCPWAVGKLAAISQEGFTSHMKAGHGYYGPLKRFPGYAKSTVILFRWNVDAFAACRHRRSAMYLGSSGGYLRQGCKHIMSMLQQAYTYNSSLGKTGDDLERASVGLVWQHVDGYMKGATINAFQQLAKHDLATDEQRKRWTKMELTNTTVPALPIYWILKSVRTAETQAKTFCYDVTHEHMRNNEFKTMKELQDSLKDLLLSYGRKFHKENGESSRKNELAVVHGKKGEGYQNVIIGNLLGFPPASACQHARTNVDKSSSGKESEEDILQHQADDELRVGHVAITRAKCFLGVCFEFLEKDMTFEGGLPIGKMIESNIRESMDRCPKINQIMGEILRGSNWHLGYPPSSIQGAMYRDSVSMIKNRTTLYTKVLGVYDAIAPTIFKAYIREEKERVLGNQESKSKKREMGEVHAKGNERKKRKVTKKPKPSPGMTLDKFFNKKTAMVIQE